MPAITSTGLGSGLDIKSLVSGLVSAEQTPATKLLDAQQTKLTTQISSWGIVKSGMSAFQGSLQGLQNSSAFKNITAVSSNTSIVTASAFNNADQASYKLEVKQLAQSQALSSSAFSSPATTVGTGTLTINFGTTSYDPVTKLPTGFTQDANQKPLTLTIDATNNTLAGLSDAINKANAGVTASIITDNSGSRLVLNSTQTGANSSMQINVIDSDGNNTDASGLSTLAFNATAANMLQNQTAQDAKLAINGLDIVSSSNTVANALKGVTLNLQQAQPGTIVTLGVSQDNTKITDAINSLVTNFNALVNTVNPLVSYDPKTQKGGPLIGDSALSSAMSKLRAGLGQIIKDPNGGSVQSLADIGIATQKDGTLTVDSAKLNSQLSSNPSGVAALFAVLGRPSNTSVIYSGSTTDTQAGNYAVNITQTATQGALTGTSPSSLTVSAGNDTFAIKVDDIQSGTIALPQKTYASYADLATQMQASINGDSAIKARGLSVAVTYDTANNRMVLTSKSYGASSQVEITGNTTTTLGLSIGAGVAGQDVAGTINGQAATGNGRTLKSTMGDAKGLSLVIDDNVIGNKGTVNFSRGIIENLNSTMSSALFATTGTVDSHTAGLQKGLDAITKARTDLQTRMDTLQARLYTQFNAMDAFMGRMQSTGSFLTQQFNALSSSNKTG